MLNIVLYLQSHVLIIKIKNYYSCSKFKQVYLKFVFINSTIGVVRNS